MFTLCSHMLVYGIAYSSTHLMNDANVLILLVSACTRLPYGIDYNTGMRREGTFLYIFQKQGVKCQRKYMTCTSNHYPKNSK